MKYSIVSLAVGTPYQYLNNHMYADDSEFYVEVAAADVHSALTRLSDCVSNVKDWCSSRRLQLNDAETYIADRIYDSNRTSLITLHTVAIW